MKIDKFKTYLIEMGVEILEPTNPYEKIRFRTINGVSVIYSGRKGFSFTGDAQEAYTAFEKKNIWQIKRSDEKQLDKIKADILSGDGENCFFCQKPTIDGNGRTVEHLLSIAHGGNNNINNLVFACHACNQAVGSMSIIEKVRYREALSHDL